MDLDEFANGRLKLFDTAKRDLRAKSFPLPRRRRNLSRFVRRSQQESIADCPCLRRALQLSSKPICFLKVDVWITTAQAVRKCVPVWFRPLKYRQNRSRNCATFFCISN